VSGHDSPAFAPNLLNLLADMGVGPGDFAEIEHLLDIMFLHQEPGGRFASFGPCRAARSRSGARCCATPIPC
jgi:hypothetical protein